MPEQIGSFIEDDGNESTKSDNIVSIANERSAEPSGGSQEPERVNGFPTINPLDIGATYGGTEPGTGDGGTGIGKRRGRPPGSRNKPRTEENSGGVIGNIEDMLMGCHGMLAMWTNTPEMELERSEAKQFSKAIQDVSKFYTQAIDPKKMAWAQLIFIAGGIYGTRYAAISKRHENEKRNRAMPGTSANPAPKMNGKPPETKPGAPATNPSQLWFQGGGLDGEVNEG